MTSILPSWSCPKKIQARHETIIKQYRKNINTSSIPLNKQYWTMCGKCVDTTTNNNLLKGCELDQILTENLITSPIQFHGVEINKTIYNLNKSLPLKTNWYNDDFYNTLSYNLNNNETFNPAIINADLLLMPEKGIKYFSKILYLISSMPTINNVMIVGNFILRARHITITPEEIINNLQDNPHYKASINKKQWKFNGERYAYNGSGRNNTIMCSIILYIN